MGYIEGAAHSLPHPPPIAIRLCVWEALDAAAKQNGTVLPLWVDAAIREGFRKANKAHHGEID